MYGTKYTNIRGKPTVVVLHPGCLGEQLTTSHHKSTK